MRKVFLTIIGLLFLQMTFAQEWHAINNPMPTDYSTKLVSSTEKSIIVDVMINGYYTNEVNTPRGTAITVTNAHMSSIVEAGQPNLPSLAIPVIIGDDAQMDVRIINSQYIDYQNIEIAPSKGDFPRTIDPDDVPYTYSPVYEEDAFFPLSQVKLYAPYILRDFRGQNIIISPFAYNPQTKVLRVYHQMRVEMYKTGEDGENVLSRRSSTIKMDPEIKIIYQDHFINYKESGAKYTVVDEAGDLLIICHDAFMTAMQPFVAWKKQIGRPVTIVGTSTAGTTPEAIKAYITTQYENNPNLTHILLVGDAPQIPGKYLNNFGNYSGKSDWWYGQMTGNDYYNELIVGRFSAETANHVTTQVDKVINYERDLDATATWLDVGQGVSKREYGSGHYGEDDYEHIDNIRDDLLAYNYSTVHRDYQNVPGVTASAATISQHINEGVSIINYCNHGSQTSWSVFNYNNTHVNALTNDYKLPYIISVACYNGAYDYGQPCFAEAWLRATNNSNGDPTGAIGGMFSYISQPWIPPMDGQDEMIDILVESYSNNIKRTMGGVSLNGNMKILDLHQNSSPGLGTYNTWNLFGDPTLILRNLPPTSMNVTHNNSMAPSSNSFTVNATNGNGALATLTRDGEIMGSATIDNGTANITFTAPGETGTATLTVIGYNKITYIATINISNSGGDPLTVNVSANPEIIPRDAHSTLNAVATGGTGNYTYSWTPTTGLNNAGIQSPVASPIKTTTYTCTVNDGNNNVSDNVTITVVVPPTNLNATVNNTNVNLSWTAANPADSYKIYRNNAQIASGVTSTSYTDVGLTPGTYSYTVRTVYHNIESPNSNMATATINAPMTVSATANPQTIAEGASSLLNATITGGTGSISYNWSPANTLNNPNIQSPVATPAITTTYTVIVTRGSETASANVTVEVLTIPTGLTANVNEDNINLTWNEVELADYYTILRNGEQIAENITTTEYDDNNLEDGEYCYTVKAVLDSVITPESDEVCAEIKGCVAPENIVGEYYWYDYEFGALIEWDKVDSFKELTEFRVYRSQDNNNYEMIQSLANVPGLVHYQFSDMNNTIGIYYYKVSSYYANGDCESSFGLAAGSDLDYVVVDVNSMNENIAVNASVYPNPTNGKINIIAERLKQVMVLNTLGQVIYKQDVKSDNLTIDLGDLESGIYILRLTTEKGTLVKPINIIKQ